MADTKISAMGNATTPLSGAELVPLVQGGVNVKTPVSNMKGQVFSSGNITMPSGAGLITQAHGMGVIPKFVRGVLHCITNDAATGYVVGQEIDLAFVSQSSSAYQAVTIYADSTNVYLANPSLFFGASVTFIQANGSSNASPTNINNFAIVLYAFNL